MKKGLGLVFAVLLTLLCVSALADVEINETNFPDANFRQYIIDSGFDSDDNKTLSNDEIAQVNGINCGNKEIQNLKGIEHFTEATLLVCSANKLTSLDVSKNTKLETLFCEENQLTSLDLSNNAALNFLSCGRNQLNNLDVSKNAALIEVNCATNQIKSLDVSKSTGLTGLYCGYNQLESLDVSKNTALTFLHCVRNQLNNLDVSKNIVLTELRCGHNQLKSLDVSNNKDLTKLGCQGNQLTTLDVSKNTSLEKLFISVNDIKALDVSRNTKLNTLCAEFNDIKELNISSSPDLCEYVKMYERQTVTAASGGWDFEGYYDTWRDGDEEYLSCNTTTKVIAGSFISEPSEFDEPAEPSVGDIFTSDGLKYKVTGKSTAAVTGAEKAKSSVAIPATVSYKDTTFKVTEIAAKAFYKDAKITAVTIGKNVKTIGKSAFEGCKKLKTVKGGAAAAEIKDAAFRGCVKLASLTLEKNVKAIGKNAFNGDKALKTITVKTAKLTAGSIMSGAFKGINKKAAFKCPKGKADAYKKLFTKAGAPKTCRFR